MFTPAPLLHVLYGEVGLRESGFVGVEGAYTTVTTRAWGVGWAS